MRISTVFLAAASVAGIGAKARADAPVAQEVRGAPMVGPYKTALEACKAAAPCGAAKVPDCSAVKSKADPYIERAADGNQKRTWIANTKYALAPVACKVADPVGAFQAQYYLYAKRADGWWRSNAPMLEVNGNDRHQEQSVDGLFKIKGDRMLLHMQLQDDSMTCNKQGSERQTVDILVVADVPAAPATPVAYAPFVIGEHQQLDHDVDIDPEAAKTCKPLRKSFVMKETWSAADTLALIGAASWYELRRAAGVLQPGFDTNKKSASSAGTFRLVR